MSWKNVDIVDHCSRHQKLKDWWHSSLFYNIMLLCITFTNSNYLFKGWGYMRITSSAYPNAPAHVKTT